MTQLTLYEPAINNSATLVIDELPGTSVPNELVKQHTTVLLDFFLPYIKGKERSMPSKAFTQSHKIVQV